MTNFEIAMLLSLIGYGIIFGIICVGSFSRIKALKDTVINLDAYINDSLDPQVKRIRQLVTDEIINKKEDTSANKTDYDWVYSIFDKDKIMAQKEQWTKEAEKKGVTLTEYLESIKPTPCRGDGKSMTHLLKTFALGKAIKELEPCEDDAISRKSAIDALWKALYEYEDKTEKQFQESDELDISDWISHRLFVQNMSDIDRNVILNLPSVAPQLKTRH